MSSERVMICDVCGQRYVYGATPALQVIVDCAAVECDTAKDICSASCLLRAVPNLCRALGGEDEAEI
ncbi:MAG: hypothetical protein WC959_10635 [Kiritimatiellales bacterium]